MPQEKVNRDEKLPPIKLTAAQYGILALMLVLIGGLWRLQVLGADSYRALAEQNRIRKVPILAPRGKLFDREGRLLVDNYPSVSCFLVREQSHNVEADLPLIAKGLDLDLDQLRATLKKFRITPSYQPIPIKQDITPDEQAFIEAHRNELPELETIDEERRLYPRDGFASHLIGYVGEVSEDDLNNPKFAYYEPGDVVGKAGVEETYDEILRGEDGSMDVIVDSHGREVGRRGIQLATPGQDLRLTIDNDIQRAAELALGNANGAVVAMDPRNGEILAMVSHPSFDPNAFAVKIGRTEWNQLITDPAHPLMNKAIQDQLAPGSTFKIIMSVAGMEEGVAENLKVMCNGGGTFYGHFFKCDKHHGLLSIHEAIPMSCDTYFYDLATKLGIDTIAKYATALGIGSKTGIDLPGEMAGVMPSTQWKMRTFHQKWYAGEVVSVGIGQGAVAVTPIQLLRAVSGIASDGHLVRPHVVNPNQLNSNYHQAVLETYGGSGDRQLPLREDTWMTVTEGMAQATTPGLYHTAEGAHLEGIDFAGKTGTAQVVGGGDTHVRGGAKTPNAWFVGMVPRRNPEFAVVVLQEHGDWGSGSAKIAAQIVTAYVNKKRRQDGNLLVVPQKTAPVEMGAIWSAPRRDAGRHETRVDKGDPEIAALEASGMQGGHFLIGPDGSIAGLENGASEIPTRSAVEDEASVVPTLSAIDAERMGHPESLSPRSQNRDRGHPDLGQVIGLPERFRGVLAVGGGTR
ncbi:penicillin-binding protein 2 [Acidicapsa dinghuensis]|uniref:Penicillin-binding protein 2 n=1 Tax=Acidicapsa dinghuensis TaxID=2218256 RepID=A0ABW1EIU3_9BACT|nr:penicillin-binding protein 2 [Acidicapsa dinghuensis]